MKKNKVNVDRTLFLWALERAAKVIRTDPSHLDMYKAMKLTMADDTLTVHGGNGSYAIAINCMAEGDMEPVLASSALASIIALMRGDVITLEKDGQTLHITDGLDRSSEQILAADPSHYLTAKTLPEEPNRMTAAAWQKLVAVVTSAPRFLATKSDSFVVTSLAEGIRVFAVNGVGAAVWDVPNEAITRSLPILAHLPIELAQLVPPGSNGLLFAVDSGTFTIADEAGLWRLSSSMYQTSSIVDMAPFLAQPSAATLSAAAPELSRCVAISDNYVITVGSGNGSISAGRIRLTSTPDGVVFRTAGDGRNFDGSPIVAEYAGEFDVTLAGQVVKGPLGYLRGRVKAEIGDAHVYLTADPYDGVRYILMPLKAVWND